jgi:hypothetical protein
MIRNPFLQTCTIASSNRLHIQEKRARKARNEKRKAESAQASRANPEMKNTGLTSRFSKEQLPKACSDLFHDHLPAQDEADPVIDRVNPHGPDTDGLALEAKLEAVSFALQPTGPPPSPRSAVGSLRASERSVSGGQVQPPDAVETVDDSAEAAEERAFLKNECRRVAMLQKMGADSHRTNSIAVSLRLSLRIRHWHALTGPSRARQDQ